MSGFTLVEVLVVLALVALLAASAAPRLAKSFDEPDDAAATSQMVSACLRIAAQSRDAVVLRASVRGSRFAITDRLSVDRYSHARSDTMQSTGGGMRAVCAPDGYVWQPRSALDNGAAPGPADVR